MMQNQTKNDYQTAEWFKRYLAYVPFGLPLLYVYPLGGAFRTELIRAIALLACALFGLSMIIYYDKLSWSKPVVWQWMVMVYVVIMIASSLLSHNKATAFFGLTGDYQGLLTQLSGIAIAYWASGFIASRDYWRHVANILGMVCFLSVIASLPQVLDGYRLAGLLLHATGVSFYAVMGLGLNLIVLNTAQTKGRYESLARGVFVASAVLILVLSGSRIGLISAALTLLCIALWLPKARKWLIISVGGIAVLASLSYVTVSPAQRLTDPNRVEQGANYRRQLYGWSLQQSTPSVLGVGASQVYEVLNDTPKVPPPPAIQKTFISGYPLWYTHSQFIDSYIEYGLAGVVLVMCLFGLSVVRIIQTIRHYVDTKCIVPLSALGVVVVLIGSLLDYLVNTPSIELLPITFFAIFSALRLAKARPQV